MNTLIVYTSKYGSVEECVKYLYDNIIGNVTVLNIKNKEIISLNEFDNIIIGGSIYIGKISKELSAFCADNLDQLLQKKVALFLCCALSEQFLEFVNNFPLELVQHACVIKHFGSETRLERMSFLDKTIIKAVTKNDFSNFKLIKANIDELIQEFV